MQFAADDDGEDAGQPGERGRLAGVAGLAGSAGARATRAGAVARRSPTAICRWRRGWPGSGRCWRPSLPSLPLPPGEIDLVLALAAPWSARDGELRDGLAGGDRSGQRPDGALVLALGPPAARIGTARCCWISCGCATRW